MSKALVKKPIQLPDTVENLQRFVLVGREALKLYQAKLKTVNRLDLAVGVRQQTLEDGQRVGEALLYAEARLGKLLADHTSRGGSMDGERGSKKSLPEGISHKQSHYAQQLAEHKDVIEEVVKEAIKDENIPTRREVLRKVKEEARTKAYQDSSEMRVKDSKYKPLIKQASFEEFLKGVKDGTVDLLLSDPPYSTDVKDIYKFAEWVRLALPKVKPEGRAYIFVGAYPKELEAYLAILNHQDIMIMDKILVWTYRTAIGPRSKMSYNLNWQAVLYLYGKKAEKLNCPLLTEQFAVQDINAPDARTGVRYHKFEKPVELAERFICHATNKDDVVLDIFAGTGTFILAATSLGRKALGCEISSEMIKIAKKRGCVVE